MSETVRFIVKSIIKVPVIIFVFYLIVNGIGFGLTYFKMLGVSYTVMQTGVENNYIPENEKESLTAYFDSLETEILEDVQFTEGTEFDRKQYGETIKVGVQANFHWILPLMPNEQTTNGVVASGYETNKTAIWLSDSEIQDKREELNKVRHNIVIEYEVPGLQYYPDME